MHLIVDQYGAFVSKHQGRIRVVKDKERLAEVPILHLEQIIICGDGTVDDADLLTVLFAFGEGC